MSKSVYEMVTDRIIEQLEKGLIPWKKPWTGTQSGAYNRISNKPYSLINQMLLKHTGEYATFKQWSDLGGKIKKGEQSEIVVFWKIQPIEETKEDNTIEKKNIPLLRYFNVFHVSQVEGVEPKERKIVEVEPIEEAEKIKNTYMLKEHIAIKEIVTNEAFYSPLRDYIQVPCKGQYKAIEEFYSTLFHEMVHSTGHKTRLDRLETGIKASFGSETYSKEELVAEIGSATIMNIVGIETQKTFKNSSAYIQNWLSVLKSDTRLIVSAASKADKAVNYILGE
ncbi:ArdC family protein [Anaerotignum sp.]|uniref:ArdC family protein n=1 Tax=Anaerotignum sp. TaxID=2039241 RepID=UPI00289DEBE5|nr:zincin-like metallopeptidase domain-containing protein [Anaerotignum sp.]